MRIYLDTNVLVSAFTTRGLSSEILRLILAEHQLVLSKVILQELQQVLQIKIKMPPEKIAEIIEFLSKFEIISKNKIDHPPELRDPNDIPILSAAIHGKVDILVTGDKDLLEADKKYGIIIINPRNFFKFVKNG